MYISWSILSLIIYDDRILIPCRICRRVRSTARTETMLSVSRAPHCDTHPAQGARLTLSEGAGRHADPRLRRLRALLPRATYQVRRQGGLAANARSRVAAGRAAQRPAAANFFLRHLLFCSGILIKFVIGKKLPPDTGADTPFHLDPSLPHSHEIHRLTRRAPQAPVLSRDRRICRALPIARRRLLFHVDSRANGDHRAPSASRH